MVALAARSWGCYCSLLKKEKRWRPARRGTHPVVASLHRHCRRRVRACSFVCEHPEDDIQTPSMQACRHLIHRQAHGFRRFHALAPPLAFVLDIDGVLIRGPDVLPAAKRALNMLEGNNILQKKIPYILLTNGGGVGEHERCERLTKQLGVQLRPSQYCQAHTILKKFADEYADKPVLVLGGKLDSVKKVARGYGYKKAYTTLDVLAWNSSVWPFHKLSESELAVAEPCDFSKTPISAIFVYHDPRNWALDVQVVSDVILAGGIIGGPYDYELKQKVELVFCNPDLVWRSEFPRPRYGQGAFKAAFQAVFNSLSGKECPHVQYGKPTEATYHFARELLDQHTKDLYGPDSCPGPRIYMVGDNPESDIAGANAAGWHSILVKSGVYDPSQGTPTHSPTHFAEDVEGAVDWAIEREFNRNRLRN